jgi:hypothetical protein
MFDSLLSDFSIGDVLDGYVDIEKAKYNQRLAGTAEQQQYLDKATYPQNTSAYQVPGAYAKKSGMSTPMMIGGGVALLIVGFIVFKAVK